MRKSLYTNQVCGKCSVKRKKRQSLLFGRILNSIPQFILFNKMSATQYAIPITGKCSSILKYWRHVTEMSFHKNFK